jgi:hypothetical protein
MGAKKILLVEGTDDEHVFKHLCGNRDVPKLSEIKSQEGIAELLKNFPVRLKESEVEIVGVVVDADTDVASRWQSLRDILVKSGYKNVPHEPSPEGVILDHPPDTLLPRVGVWIMPDNKTTGILEDFLRFLVPENVPLFHRVKSNVADIPEAERRFRKIDESKVLIHTWLAWQEKPGKPLGTAITAKYLEPNVAQVDVLISWLNRLFFEMPEKTT